MWTRASRLLIVVMLAASATSAFARSPQIEAQRFSLAQQNQQQQTANPKTEPSVPSQSDTKKISDASPRQYSQGNRALPDAFSPYMQLSIPLPRLSNTDRMGELVKDGKLNLSLQDAVELALEDSTDVAVARYNPWLAEATLLKARSSSAAANVASFDPLYTLVSGATTSNAPVSNPISTGAGTGVSLLSSHTFTTTSTYTQGFASGTNLQIVQSNTRSSGNGANTFNPLVSSSVNIALQQNLLYGFGHLPNERFILVAKNTVLLNDLAFKQQVLSTVTQVETDYWELVYARQFEKIQTDALRSAQKLLDDFQKLLNIGTIAVSDVKSAEANVAAVKLALVQARTQVLLNQLVLLGAISKDMRIPGLTDLEIIPLDQTYVPPSTENLPLTDAISEALVNRPDYQQFLVSLNTDKINVRATRNELLPNLSVQGNYGWNGLGGDQVLPGAVVPNTFSANLNEPIVDANGTPAQSFAPIVATLPPTTSNAGIGTALNQIFSGQFPIYGAQTNFNVTLRNRSAQADSIAALTTANQDATKTQQELNTIATDVHNTQLVLSMARETLAAAQVTLDIQKKALDATTKEFYFGTPNVTELSIVQQQQFLIQDESLELRLEVNLIEARIQFDRAMGRTLAVNNIEVQTGRGLRR